MDGEVKPMKFSELLAKPLLSLSEGSIIGEIRNCLLSPDRTRLLALETSDGWVDAAVVKVGEGAVLVKSRADVLSAPPEPAAVSPLYLDLFLASGKFCGKIIDLCFDEKYRLTHFTADGEDYSRGLLLSCGENAVIVCANPDELRRERRRLGAEQRRPEPVSSDIEKASSNFSYLIGRKVLADIFNQRGEKIVKKNAVVSARTLQICKEYGKLLTLAKNCKAG